MKFVWEDQLKVARVRASILFDPFLDLIKDKHVLELAPFDGWFTRELFQLGAKKITAIEASGQAVIGLKENFENEIADGRLDLREADLHLELYKLDPHQIDTVICTGFLYHTPHVFWVLEGIVRLQPQTVLIESFHHDQLGLVPEAVNQVGCRQAIGKTVPYYLGTSEHRIIQTMQELGYKVRTSINKFGNDFSSLDNCREDQKEYFKLCMQQFAIWFEYDNLAQSRQR